jgi:hypothetical protein
MPRLSPRPLLKSAICCLQKSASTESKTQLVAFILSTIPSLIRFDEKVEMYCELAQAVHSAYAVDDAGESNEGEYCGATLIHTCIQWSIATIVDAKEARNQSAGGTSSVHVGIDFDIATERIATASRQLMPAWHTKSPDYYHQLLAKAMAL